MSEVIEGEWSFPNEGRHPTLKLLSWPLCLTRSMDNLGFLELTRTAHVGAVTATPNFTVVGSNVLLKRRTVGRHGERTV